MKKIITVVTLVGIILSSCTSSKNALVLKRKYNKGFYVAHNHKKNSTDLTKPSNEIEKTIDTKKTEELVVVLPSVSEISKTESSTSDAKSELNPKKINEVKHNTVYVDSKVATASLGKTEVKTKHHEVNIDKKSKSSSGGDANFILLIVFCFFPILSLIAMYLHDDKSITLNFWINLLLYLTFIGWIIFGLLVVLDIINLA